MTDNTSTDQDRMGGQQSGQGGSSPLAGLQSIAQNAATQLNDRTMAARDWASQQTDVARQTVVERPFVSAGAAFAAGVVFGVLLARR